MSRFYDTVRFAPENENAGSGKISIVKGTPSSKEAEEANEAFFRYKREEDETPGLAEEREERFKKDHPRWWSMRNEEFWKITK